MKINELKNDYNNIMIVINRGNISTTVTSMERNSVFLYQMEAISGHERSTSNCPFPCCFLLTGIIAM